VASSVIIAPVTQVYRQVNNNASVAIPHEGSGSLTACTLSIPLIVGNKITLLGTLCAQATAVTRLDLTLTSNLPGFSSQEIYLEQGSGFRSLFNQASVVSANTGTYAFNLVTDSANNPSNLIHFCSQLLILVS
jgi:hypothetical protein